MDRLLNDIILSQDVVDSLFNMSADVVESCDIKAKEICKTLFPKIDLTREENIELVVRPMSAVIALNELLLQQIFSMSTIDGVFNSATIPDAVKASILKNFAKLNGIDVVSNDPDSIYSEIVFGASRFNLNNKSTIHDILYSSENSIDRLFFADSSTTELSRNKIPYLQLNSLKVMNFERSELNRGTLIGTAYSRSDYQTYQDYKTSNAIVMPGMIDIYFSNVIERGTLSIQKNTGDRYVLPEGFYISVSPTSGKNFVLLENDLTFDGIVNFSPEIYVTDGSAIEDFEYIRYTFIDFSQIISNDEFMASDVIYKGFYPAFIDFTVYCSGPVEKSQIKDSISSYLLSVGGNMSDVSHLDMVSKIRKDGNNVTVSSTNVARIYASANIAFQSNMTFPLSMRDITIPGELTNSSYSKNTIKLFTGDINVVQE